MTAVYNGNAPTADLFAQDLLAHNAALAAIEACAVHGLAAQGRDRRQAILSWQDATGWHDKPVSVRDIAAEIHLLVQQQPHANLYISQSQFFGPRRLLEKLASIGVVAIDVDAESEFGSGWDVDQVLSEIYAALHAVKCPSPSYVAHSGHGLHLKWLLTSALPAAALKRWEAVMRRLLELLKPWGADPQAADAARVLRLVGSTNNKRAPIATGLVRYEGRQGPFTSECRVDFEDLAAALLPATREQCRQARERAKVRGGWHENRRRVLEHDAQRRGGAVRPAKRSGHWISVGWAPHDRKAFGIAARRLRMLDGAIVDGYSAGVVPKGLRNSVGWLAANCVAGMAVASGVDPVSPISAWMHRMIPSLTNQEIRGIASSVLRRARHPMALEDGSRGLYRFTEPHWRARVAAALKFGPEHALWRPGSIGGKRPETARQRGRLLEMLGLLPMRGLSVEEYLAERHERQAAGGRFSAAVRRTTHGADRVAQALELAAQGNSAVSIGQLLGLPARTVSGWVRETREQLRRELAPLARRLARQGRSQRVIAAELGMSRASVAAAIAEHDVAAQSLAGVVTTRLQAVAPGTGSTRQYGVLNGCALTGGGGGGVGIYRPGHCLQPNTSTNIGHGVPFQEPTDKPRQHRRLQPHAPTDTSTPHHQPARPSSPPSPAPEFEIGADGLVDARALIARLVAATMGGGRGNGPGRASRTPPGGVAGLRRGLPQA